MAVTDSSWWGVWWLWMLIWGTTVVSTVVAVTITVTHWRTHRRIAGPPKPSVPLYLHDRSVMDLHDLHGGKYRQEIEQKIVSSLGTGVLADLAPVQAGGNWGKTTEVVRRWVEKTGPITVIGSIIEVLDGADDIVYVNLRKREVTSNHALDKVLSTADDERPDAVRLRGVEAFVSVRGSFRVTERTSSTVMFQAPYGEPTDPTDGAQVRVTCAASGLRDSEIPTGSFTARCLGQVVDWDPQEHRLVLHPIAIFR